VNPGLAVQIFFAFLRISFISFGGVVAVLPVLERIVVTDHHWLTHDEFMQSYVLAQFVPGPNVALFPMLGYRIDGWPGFLAGFFGIYSAPLLIMGVAYAGYRRLRGNEAVRRAERGLRPLILGLLFSSGAQIAWMQSQAGPGANPWVSRGVALGVIAFGYLMLLKKRMHPLVVILLSGTAWLAISELQRV
jgi:chromate transporter